MRDSGAFPILDHDDDPADLISAAQRAQPRVALPPRAVLTLLGDVASRYAEENGYVVVDEVETIIRRHPVRVGTHRGVEVAFVEIPLGGPAATILFEHVLMSGVEKAVAVGSCGGLVHFDEGEFVLPSKALRAEGTSYHYLPPSDWVETHAGLRAACAAAIDDAGLHAREAVTWTTDAFYRETRATLAARLEQGCELVEMECASLAACAQFRGVEFAQILYTADTLSEEDWDARRFGRDAREVALTMALDAVVR
ncbi:nucleoside phosphorylase [Mobilicoccus pelagius]|uniref:Uridine phosphorylase n=1 Tax=Mobilicoccus pelagius NBRC 104925 TaxID=1089455 RepID=H5UNY3_9MICO|nr:nucleoside phosphorylase [Mobilicoccus pelagius]GAB47441.1 putative phosphorylase [Mobilicoccus pelagius NBRC 104925]